MERTPVTSSSLKSVGHEGDTLEVEFSSGKVYRYAGVSREHFDGLLAAGKPDEDGKPGSIGRHFNEQIRGAFEHTRVEETADENGDRG